MGPWIIPAILSIFGAREEYKAGKEMERLAQRQEIQAEQNALLQRQELQEQVRRQEAEDERLRSRTLARAAASGARVEGGSIASYMQYMEDEQERQLNWMQKAGASRIRLELAGAKTRASAARLEAESYKRKALFSTIGTVWGYADKGGLFTSPKKTD